MSFFHNDPTTEFPYASLNATDWSQVSSRAVFEEFCLIESDDHVHLAGYASDFDGIKKMNAREAGGGLNRDWKFEPSNVAVKFAKKTYKKWDSVAKKQIDAEPSRTEQYYAKVLSNFEAGKVYSGKFLLKDDAYMDMVIKGVDPFGKPIPQENLDVLNAGFFSIQEVAEPIRIKPDDIKIPQAKQWGSRGSSGQSEYDKLTDRIKFIKEQMAIADPEFKMFGVHDFDAAKLSGIPNGDIIYSTWINCLAVIGVNARA
jgi:hypothetical protein